MENTVWLCLRVIFFSKHICCFSTLRAFMATGLLNSLKPVRHIVGNEMPGNGLPRFIAGILYVRIETVQPLSINGYPEPVLVVRLSSRLEQLNRVF